MSSPDEEVATRIVEQFRKQGILSEKTLAKLEPLLASGKLSAEGWKAIFDFDQREDKRE